MTGMTRAELLNWGKLWTEEEKQFLVDHQYVSINELADILVRTPKSVRRMLAKLQSWRLK